MMTSGSARFVRLSFVLALLAFATPYALAQSAPQAARKAADEARAQADEAEAKAEEAAARADRESAEALARAAGEATRDAAKAQSAPDAAAGAPAAHPHAAAGSPHSGAYDSEKMPPELQQLFGFCQQACACAYPGGKIMPAHPAAAAGGGQHGGGNPHANPHGPGYGYNSASRMAEMEELFSYPIPFVERPLILPEGVTQPEIVGMVISDAAETSRDLTKRLSLGFQSSWGGKAQLGMIANVTINPNVSLGSVYGIAQAATGPFMNARLDAGVRRLACGTGAAAFSGGIGLPVKYRVGSRYAITSGRPAAFALIDDVVTWDVKACGTNGTVGLPIGVLATYNEIVNVGLRTGYRKLVGTGVGTSFVPFGADLAVMIGRQTDVGLTLELPNPLGAPNELERDGHSVGFAFERRFMVFGQTRF